jgi:phosphoribosylformylglycinamidine synthase subunit PurS
LVAWVLIGESGRDELPLIPFFLARRRVSPLTDEPEIIPTEPFLLQIFLYAARVSPDSFAVKLEVVVMPKRNVLDPQGVAVRNAVRELGLSNVGTVRVGKIIEIEFTGEPDEAKLDEICRDLLCNQVIEDYRILGAVLK